MNSGRSHKELCDNLVKNKIISNPLIEYAFRKSDRKFFDPSMHPYEDRPHDIGGGATISAAHMHAIGLESLGDALVPLNTTNVQIPPKTFLDIGSGSGFLTCAMGHIIHNLRSSPQHSINARKSRVVGIEIHEGLLKQSIENIRACLPEMVNESHPVDGIVKSGNVLNNNNQDVPIANLMVADAFSTKSKLPYGPFDAIHSGVAIDFIPLSLLAQLKPGGRLVIPIKLAHTYEQDFVLFTRKHIVDGADTTNINTDLFDKACKIQQNGDRAQIGEFLNTFCTFKSVVRCIYIMARNNKNVPTNIPARVPIK
jgi:protein-L-isoaspartate(D-aspartate) O-methyltransferase